MVPPTARTLTQYRPRRKNCLTATRCIREEEQILEEPIILSNREIEIDADNGPKVAPAKSSLHGGPDHDLREKEDQEVRQWTIRKGLVGSVNETYESYSYRVAIYSDRSRFLRRLYDGDIPFLHHSCNPNAYLAHLADTGRVVAIRKIRQGEEVTILYGGENIEFLEAEYGFRCHCSRTCFRRSEGRKPTLAEMRDDHRIRRRSWRNGYRIRELCIWKRLRTSITHCWNEGLIPR